MREVSASPVEGERLIKKAALGQSRQEVEAAVGVCQYFDLRQEIPLPRKHDLQYATTSHAFMEHHAALMLPRHVAPLIPQADLCNVWGNR